MMAERKPNTGMMVRHFDHPSGARATLESPQGWAKTCFFRLTVFDAEGKQVGEPEMGSFDTPAAARAGAVEREKTALKNGWRPRNVAMSPTTDASVFLYADNGIPLALRVQQFVIEAPSVFRQDNYDRLGGQQPNRSVNILAQEIQSTLAPTISPGDHLLFRERYNSGGETCGRVRILQVEMHSPNYRGQSSFAMHGVLTQLPEGRNLNNDIERAVAREQVIERHVGTTQTMQELWTLLATEVPDAAKRQELCREILARRIDRTQAEAEARRREEDRQRSQREQVLRDQMMSAAMASRQRPLIPTGPSPAEVAKAMKKLAGGKEIGQPKKRKINLGE